jgi:hypothetical protein
VAVKAFSGCWTTLLASRGHVILARRPVDNSRTLTRVPYQEKSPSTTDAVGADPSRTPSMLHAETFPRAQIPLRVRDSHGEDVELHVDEAAGFVTAAVTRV